MHLRVAGYFLVYILIWVTWSFRPLMNGEHSAFQAAGTVIISWAVLFIARDRLRFERSIHSAEFAALIASINRLEAHRAVTEKRLSLTFDLHALHISRHALELGIPSSIGPGTKEEWEVFAKEIDEKIRGLPPHYIVDEDRIHAGFAKDLKLTKSTFEPWRRYAFICEVSFLVIGTLQTGYGSAFSEYLAEIGFITFLKNVFG